MNHKTSDVNIIFPVTFFDNFTSFALIASDQDYLFLDLDRCMPHPPLAEKGLRGSKIISFDLKSA